MKIEWLGHSCFRINNSLIIDPYKDGSVPGYDQLRISADKVICTHEHADHAGRECISLTGEECPLKIREVMSWHDDKNGALRGPNTIFIVECDGEKLVHLGDLGHFPNNDQLAAIKDVDYLLIPVGGHYTIDGAIATIICESARPKIAIPMHYRWDKYGYREISTVDVFMKAMRDIGLDGIVELPTLTTA